ncbi:hypothetical protein [Massilia consociata]|uniref:Uncharacterized protein n=1 Tax=Massilia consociata TaxID=760117 RepID=A0ABV6FDT0_9BURK
MLNLFTRPFRQQNADLAGLGTGFVALPILKGSTVPAGCFAVLATGEGRRTRRLSEGARVSPVEGETAWCVHPGPYTCDLAPFAAAPEIGLRVGFAIDGPDPRETQQRFDLYLASEGGERVALDVLVAQVEAALQRELAQGNLDLPPCTTLEEWNAFRSGFNQLLYTRFGVTVDDCVPVDLGATRDLAALLAARLADQPAADLPAGLVTPGVPEEPQAFDPARADGQALRRLFLELPCVMCSLRLAVLPQDCADFRRHQDLLRRLDLVSLSVGTMPALELAAPGQALPGAQRLRRARHSRRAVAALDEAWALLARMKTCDATLSPARIPALLEEADRIVANLESECAARRAVDPGEVAQ